MIDHLEVNDRSNLIDMKLATYYTDRAHEYDAIYFKPERQNNLALVVSQVAGLLNHF